MDVWTGMWMDMWTSIWMDMWMKWMDIGKHADGYGYEQ